MVPNSNLKNNCSSHPDLIYLFNATVFDYTTMKCAVVARMQANKENSDFYKKAFELMFKFRHQECPQFQLDKTLKGVIVDWSDTERKGLRDAIGEAMADEVLRGTGVDHTTELLRELMQRLVGLIIN